MTSQPGWFSISVSDADVGLDARERERGLQVDRDGARSAGTVRIPPSGCLSDLSGRVGGNPHPLILLLPSAAGTGWIHFTACPGSVRGNAIETVHYTTPGTARGGFARDASAVVGDPRIVYPSDLRLSLLPDSPAIDRGSLALPFTITDDLYGRVTRPLGAARDLGAIEVR